MPNEPPTSNFAQKIQPALVQSRRQGGLIWVYMGPDDTRRRFPIWSGCTCRPSYRAVHKRVQECNWLQNLEGEVDSSHAPFLHGSVGPDGMLAYNGNDDRHPVFSVVETDFGMAIAARRDAPNDHYYWRITPFMLPSYTIVPRAREANYIFTAAIPIDDENMMGMTVIWSPDHPINVPPGGRRGRQVPLETEQSQRLPGRSRIAAAPPASPVFAACASRTWPSRKTSAARSRIAVPSIWAPATRASSRRAGASCARSRRSSRRAASPAAASPSTTSFARWH